MGRMNSFSVLWGEPMDLSHRLSFSKKKANRPVGSGIFHGHAEFKVSIKLTVCLLQSLHCSIVVQLNICTD